MKSLIFACAAISFFGLGVSTRAQEVNFFAVGDWGAAEDPKSTDAKNQMQVIAAMKDYMQQQSTDFHLNAVLLLGDNYYDDAKLKNYDRSHLDKVFDERFVPEMFSTDIAGAKKPVPFYFVLGNHDYEKGDNSKEDFDKTRMELDYAKLNPRFKFPPAEGWNLHGDSHAALPDTWYAVDFPGRKTDGTETTEPLVTILALDSNYDHLKAKSKIQDEWLENRLTALNSGKHRWVMCMAHSPVFTNGCHQSDPASVRRRWLASLNSHSVDFYLSGHNHDMEHLEISGGELAKLGEEYEKNKGVWSKFALRGNKWLQPSLLVSGGGGGEHTYPLRDGKYGPFSRRLFGFVHLRFASDKATVTFVSFESGKTAKDAFVTDKFTRSLDGTVDGETATDRKAGEIGNCGHMH